MAEAKDGKAKKKARSKSPEFLKDLSYEMGSISRSAVERLKKLADKDIHKQLGKSMGVFRSDVETGWRKPEKVIVKDAIKIEGNPSGVIVGSFARCAAEELKKSYETTARFLGKVYKKGRIAVLVRMWELEHPDAAKAEKETAAKKIEQLFKSKE